MPPVPLRLLVQPWDEDDEDGYYDEQDYDGSEFDYHHRYTDYEEDEEEEEEERMGAAEEKGEREALRGPEVDGAFDPYAFDVPINITVDMQGLVQGNTKAGYGYI